VVMQQDRNVVRAELDVVLDHTEAMTGAFSEGGARVFGCQATGTPVGNQLRIWPFREWAGHGKRLRAMAAGGDRASFYSECARDRADCQCLPMWTQVVNFREVKFGPGDPCSISFARTSALCSSCCS